jgi:hypothetical protein
MYRHMKIVLARMLEAELHALASKTLRMKRKMMYWVSKSHARDMLSTIRKYVLVIIEDYHEDSALL